MKAITKFVIGLALVGSVVSAGAQNKPMEITIGANFWTGDMDSVGGDSGWVVGLDYYLPNQGNMNGSSFIGARAWFDEVSGTDVTAYGVHYGWRFPFSQNGNMNDPMANFYAKVAAGFYANDIEGADAEWGFGWFAGIGYNFQGNASVEFGYQQAPDNTGFDNRSWYATVGFRI